MPLINLPALRRSRRKWLLGIIGFAVVGFVIVPGVMFTINGPSSSNKKRDLQDMGKPDPRQRELRLSSFLEPDSKLFTRGASLIYRKQVGRGESFSGSQSLADREESLDWLKNGRAKPLELHCGFLAVSQWDYVRQITMSKKCDVVMATAFFGAQDRKTQPCSDDATFAEQLAASKGLQVNRICYIAFTDSVTKQWWISQPVQTKMLHGSIHWELIELPDDYPVAFSQNPRMNGRTPKHLLHRFFPQANYLIWVDGKIMPKIHPLNILSRSGILQDDDVSMVVFQHPKRQNGTWGEAVEVLTQKLESDDKVSAQIQTYRSEGFDYEHSDLMLDSQIIIRKNDLAAQLLGCLWFNELWRFSARDQLSFFPLIQRTGLQSRVKVILNFAPDPSISIHEPSPVHHYTCRIAHVNRHGVGPEELGKLNIPFEKMKNTTTYSCAKRVLNCCGLTQQ